MLGISLVHSCIDILDNLGWENIVFGAWKHNGSQMKFKIRTTSQQILVIGQAVNGKCSPMIVRNHVYQNGLTTNMVLKLRLNLTDPLDCSHFNLHDFVIAQLEHGHYFEKWVTNS